MCLLLVAGGTYGGHYIRHGTFYFVVYVDTHEAEMWRAGKVGCRMFTTRIWGVVITLSKFFLLTLVVLIDITHSLCAKTFKYFISHYFN